MIEKAVLAVALLFLAACGSPQHRPSLALWQAQKADQTAHRAMREGNLARAREMFTQTLLLQQALDNHDAVAVTSLNLAVVEHRLGNDATALQHLDRLLAGDAMLYSSDLRSSAALRKAVIQLDGGDREQAEITLQQAANECPAQCSHAVGIINLRARMALEKGDNATALQLAKSAMAASGIEKEEFANAHRMSGAAEFALGQHAAALNHYQEALEMDKELGISARIFSDLSGIAKVLEQLGRMKEAETYTRRAMAVNEAALKISGSAMKKQNAGAGK